jgi:hypothetical protein
MTKIYLDESGYTGEDLMDPRQTFFVICTHSIDEATCQAIKAKHFAEVKAVELKHSRLASRPRQARMLLGALGDLSSNHRDQISVGLTDKRYATLAKIVDLVIETSMHKAGFNLYKNGGNIALTNVMYASMDLDPPYLDRVLRAFQRWMRERTYQRQFELNWLLAQPHPIEPVDHFRLWIRRAFLHVGYAGVLDGLGPGALDLSLSTAINLIGIWRDKLNGAPIELVHDRSSNMAKQKDIWDALVSPTAPAAVVGYDTRKRTYPLGVTQTNFVDGKTCIALQVADIIAGAVAAFAESRRTSERSEYIEGLEALFAAGGFFGYEFLPSLDNTPEALGTIGQDGIDPLAYTAALMFNAEVEPE